MKISHHLPWATWPSHGIFLPLFLFLLFLSGCARYEQQATLPISQEPARGTECGDLATNKPGQHAPSHPVKEDPLDTSALPDPVVEAPPAKGRSTQECYQPPAKGPQGKKIKSQRCEPQSLPFARCRSGISSCCLGWNNGPLTWFACEKKHNNTSVVPAANSVLILAANNHNMPTGHVAYVEEVIATEAPNYRIVFSHTNYDRRCSLETNIEALYNSSTKTLDVLTGAWKDWGKKLPVSGFILR